MNQLTILCCHLLDIGGYYIEAYFSLEKVLFNKHLPKTYYVLGSVM